MNTRNHSRSIQFIKKQVDDILQGMKLNSLPIKIEDVAKKAGLTVSPFDFEDDISGVLVIQDGKGVIGYNQSESRVRRRFTIAHELGHFVLHREQSSMFMDKGFNAIFRSAHSGLSEQTQILEREANTFAAYILMPDHLLKEAIEKIDFDLGSEDEIKNLAKVFDVSSQAMYYRILNSGLLKF